MNKLLLSLIFLTSSIASVERHAHLSFTQQSIHVLKELIIQDIEPVERIIFLHIPKTAGTNLDNIAHAISDLSGNFHYQRLPIPRIPGKPPNLMTPGWIGGLQQLENNPNLLDTVPNLFFLTGHFPYGLHTHFTKPSKYVTLIRHPLKRELSDANFAYQRGYIDSKEFKTYLTERMIDNPQVRLIAGKEYMTGPCTEKTLAQAQENIERDFLLAAPTDDVDVFFQILASIQQWGPIAYAPMQITEQKVMEKLEPPLANTLLQKHEWDLKLYEWIKVRWDAYKKEMILGCKELSSETQVLTLMPNHLSTRRALFLSIHEIDAYNHEHMNEGLLELQQLPYQKDNIIEPLLKK
ncbi:MAG: hypothetical protein V4494_08170 [Chlamydiota bacterium]